MASIALHEIGHLVPGKLFDVKTTQYFVGFGRTLWSRRIGETEYGVKAIPLGGYVRFVGMYPPAPDHPGQVRAARTGIFQTLADNARAAEWETIRPEDDGRLFYQKKTWQKLIIMAGGPTMNLLLAFVLLFGVTATYGVYRIPADREPGAGVHRRRRRDRPKLRRQAEDAGVPVGIQPGDTVVAFNGRPIDSWEQMSRGDPRQPGRPAQITVQRAGQTVRAQAGEHGDQRRAGPLGPGQAGRGRLLRGRAGGRAGARRPDRRAAGHVGDDAADGAGPDRLPGQGGQHRVQPDHRPAARHLRADEHRGRVAARPARWRRPTRSKTPTRSPSVSPCSARSTCSSPCSTSSRCCRWTAGTSRAPSTRG